MTDGFAYRTRPMRGCREASGRSLQSAVGVQDPRRFVYKLTCDNGGAPCVYRGMLSLAICKPAIRRRAEKGDIIYGFAGSTLHRDNRLVYIAHVTEVAEGTSYWDNDRFERRPDCIYQRAAGGEPFERRPDAIYHPEPENLLHDLGPHPDYENARVLLSTNYRYFGRDCELELSSYPALARFVARIGRGDRVNFSPEVEDDLLRLEREAWKRYGKRRLGRPSSTDPAGRLSGGSCMVLDSARRTIKRL
jgi:Nucleotide modification associated domain 2